MSRSVLPTAALVPLVLSTGCASIVGGHNQSVSVEARTDVGAPLNGANCKLANDKGTWFVTTPGSTMVRRSFNDMAVECSKEPHSPGLVTVQSNTKAMAFGNIIFGGLIGVGVDMASGAAYDYPPLITVQMGKVVAPEPTPAASAPASTAAAGSSAAQQDQRGKWPPY